MDVKKINTILKDFEELNEELYRHSERVAFIAYVFSQQLNLSYEEREIAYFSGLLHDIGRFYMGVVKDDTDDKIDSYINGSIIYFDKEFSNVMNVINSYDNAKEEDTYNYNFNINIIKIIVRLSNEYDELRNSGLTHEKTCQVLRQKEEKYNNMITEMLKAIIKNGLNHEY